MMTGLGTLLRLGIAAALAPFALGAAGCSYAVIRTGEIGVVWTPQGRAHTLPEGEWSIGFWDKTTVYNARSQERAERLEVLAANGLRIELDTSIRYHIEALDALTLDHDLGVHYYSVLVGPTLRSQARRVVGRYQPEEIYSTQRELIERQIREGVETAIRGRHIVLEAVLIRNVTLPEVIQAAINDKLQAEQRALKMKFVIAQAEAEAQKQLMEVKAEADRNKIQALSQAEIDRVRAHAVAEGKRIEGQGMDDYERLVQQHMSDRMLKWQQIEAMRALAQSPNAKVILLGEGKTGGPILDIK